MRKDKKKANVLTCSRLLASAQHVDLVAFDQATPPSGPGYEETVRGRPVDRWDVRKRAKPSFQHETLSDVFLWLQWDSFREHDCSQQPSDGHLAVKRVPEEG